MEKGIEGKKTAQKGNLKIELHFHVYTNHYVHTYPLNSLHEVYFQHLEI